MNRRIAVRTIVTAGAGSVLVPRLFSGNLADDPLDDPIKTDDQTSKKDDQDDYILRSNVVLVLLDVSVKDGQGHLVPGLSKDDFAVLDEGKPQKITVFDNVDRPVTMGILLDESRSMVPKRRDVVSAAQTLIEECNPQDELFVLHFNDRVTAGLPRDVPFSGDIEQLRLALARGVPDGRTAVHDAVVAGLRHLRLGQRDKKTLVLISDGGDTASTHTRRETVAMVENDVATIYTIGLFQPDDPDKNPGFLRELAKISGGEVYLPSSTEEMMPLCRRIAKEIRSRYTVGFAPEVRKGRAGNPLRHVQVRAHAQGLGKLTVRTRSSYRYEG